MKRDEELEAPIDASLVRLVYIDGSWAWFAEHPELAHGDDWNDAPHEYNAGPPYPEISGTLVKVAYDGDLEIVGDCGAEYGVVSVDQVNGSGGKIPWLYQPSYGYDQFPEPLMMIPAYVTLREFIDLVASADGTVYR